VNDRAVRTLGQSTKLSFGRKTEGPVSPSYLTHRGPAAITEIKALPASSVEIFDRDLVFMMSSYAIVPGTAFNRAFPGIDPLPVRLGDKVRVRIANLTMTNHPIHLHGHRFAVICTDGGWVPESAQWPQASVDVLVGEIRAIDFVADNPGDWAFHCHESHATKPNSRPIA
jgi:FtsP/CotA-like multicopper oxidase with cupredoxin domain